ncbi:MAG TPA: MFS transporter [Cellvibrio sp.]|nr:MFS transporter [Cellvibrio sp.]
MDSSSPQQHRWRDLGLLLASTMTIMAGATLAPALPGMRDAFSQEPHIEFWVKFLLAVPGLCIALSAPFFGRYLMRNARKPLLVAGLIVCGISGTAGYFFNDSLLFLLITRIILGFAVAAIMVTGMTLAADYYQGPPLANYMGLQAAFGGFGGVVFMAGAGLLADTHWTNPFLIYLLALAILPITFLFLTEPLPKNNSANQTASQSTLSTSKKMMWMFCGFAFAEMILLYLIPLNFPFFIAQLSTQQTINSAYTSPAAVGIIMAVWLLLAALVSRYYAKFGQTISFQHLQAYGLLLIGMGFTGMYLTNQYWVIVASLLLSGIGFGIIRPNLVVWLFSFTPPALRGLRIGTLTRWYFIGQIICALIAAPLATILGYAGSYFLFAGFAFLLGLLLIVTNSGAINVNPASSGQLK